MEKIRMAFIQRYKKIEYPTIYSLVCLVLCWLTLEPMKVEAGWLTCIVIYVICYVSAQNVKENASKARDYVNSKMQFLFLALLFIYTTLSVCGIVYLEPDGLDDFASAEILFVPMVMVWMFPVFLSAANMLNSFVAGHELQSKCLAWKWKAGAFGLLMLNYTLWIIAFNPCITSPDSEYLFYQAHVMGEVAMKDWQPPFYAIVLSFLIRICDSATFLVYVQCIFFAFVLVEFLTTLLKKGIPVRNVIIVYIVLGFAFNTVIQMITLWKDIPYMISIFWLTLLLVQLIWNKKDGISFRWCVECTIALIFTGLFRQNGLIPALVSVISLILFFAVKKLYKAIVPVALAVCMIFFIKGIVYDHYGVIAAPGLKYFALANDIMGVYYSGDDLPEGGMQIVMEITENDPENWNFNSYYTRYNSEALGAYSVNDFLRIYVETFFKHPKTMTREILRRNSVIWSVIKAEKEIPNCVNYQGESHGNDLEYTYPKRKENYLTGTFAWMSDHLTENSLIYIFAWKTGIYLLLCLYLLYFVWIYKRKIYVLMPFLPIIFNEAALAAGSGWPDYRYYWPCAMISVMLLMYVQGEVLEKDNFDVF